jgi:hypothetical protein
MRRFRSLRSICWLAVFTAAWLQGQQTMPRIEGESFAGRNVVIPDATKGHVVVLVFGFTRKSKEPTSAWAAKINSEFGGQAGFELYQMPVLEDVPRLVRGMVISGIKKGVKEDMRDQFVPILSGETELKTLVGYREPDDAYLVILDPAGQIVGQIHGSFSDSAYQQLRNQIQAQLHH